MKKIYSFLLLSILCTAGFSEMPQWKKQVLVGSAITVGAAGALTGAVFTLPRGIILLDSEDEAELGAAIGLTVGGCLLLSAGIAAAVAGPIVIAQGIRTRHEEKLNEISLVFSPIHNKDLDKYQCSLNGKKFASVSINF